MLLKLASDKSDSRKRQAKLTKQRKVSKGSADVTDGPLDNMDEEEEEDPEAEDGGGEQRQKQQRPVGTFSGSVADTMGKPSGATRQPAGKPKAAGKAKGARALKSKGR